MSKVFNSINRSYYREEEYLYYVLFRTQLLKITQSIFSNLFY